ncbi:alpha-methylacyl-CoA racemase isoform X2 [Girardinichthys multiradiatus]|uniref:alpha-methylacyl-CoA racemase isoform X2 n=1 Tax=Girardinichthys multiradiatus TaxID=208333 RepID=UPI001FAC8570|nr:alpha-methylacyl-CoA racemase isoform X2 [Girardinichthys multiradiatus]
MALAGVKVIELAGLAPAPFCGMVLADFGAKVIRVDRTKVFITGDTLARGKRSVAINLKTADGVALLRRLCVQSDVVLEPYRKGVMEKLGLSPYELLRENPRLIFARLTGYGQNGCYATAAGHDINYLAMSALLERTRSGKGQIIDASMVEGAAFTGSFLWKSLRLGFWNRPRGENLLDSGAPFYDTYKTLDGQYLAVGAMEAEFYDQLLKGLELDAAELPPQMSISDWPELKQLFTERFASKTQADWLRIFDGTDACVTPVLSFDQVSSHPHNRERGSFIKNSSGEEFPRPAPVLSRTPAEPCLASDPAVGEHTVEVLQDYGYTSTEIDKMLASGVVECNAVKAKL